MLAVVSDSALPAPRRPPGRRPWQAEPGPPHRQPAEPEAAPSSGRADRAGPGAGSCRPAGPGPAAAAARPRAGRSGACARTGGGRGRRPDAAAEVPATGRQACLSPVVRRLIAEHGLDPARSGAPAWAVASPVPTCWPDRPAHRRGGRPAPPRGPDRPRRAAAPARRGSGSRRRRPPARRRPRPPAPGRSGGRGGGRRHGRAVHQHPAPHGRAHGAVEGHVPHTMVAVEVDYSGVERVRRAEGSQFREAEGFSLTYLPFIARAVVDALRDFPHVNSSVGEDALIVHHDLNMGIAVDLDFEGLLVPVDPPGRRQAVAGPGPRDPRTGHPGPDQAADGGRHLGRDFHHHQRRALRHVHHGPDDQPAAGGHPVDRRGPQAAGGGRAGRRLRRHRHAPGRAIWSCRGTTGPFDGAYAAAFVAADQAECSRPATGRPSCERGAGAAGPVAGPGALPGRPGPAARPVVRRAATTGCCCSSTPTSSPWGCGPSPTTSSSTRPRWGPSWCAPTGVATSPTTGRASWSATRSCHVPMGPQARRPAHVHARRAAGDRRPGRARACRGRAGCDGYPGVWIEPRRARPAQDLRHRGPGPPGPFHARLRPERGAGHGVLRPDRALRHRRQAGDVDGRRRARRAMADGRRASWPGRGAIWGRPSVDRQDVAWRAPAEDLAPFSRGEGWRRPRPPVRMLGCGCARPESIPTGASPSESASPSGCG